MKVIETYTTYTGGTYTLYETGKSFKTVLETPEKTLRSGKVVPPRVEERRHTNMSSALNSSMRLPKWEDYHV